MISESKSTFQIMFRNSEMSSLSTENQVLSPSLETLNHLSSNTSDSHSTSLLHNFSVLKEKVHQIQSVFSLFFSDENPPESSPPPSMAISTMNSLIQEIIMTASSMLFTCQQMNLAPNSPLNIVAIDELNSQSQNWFNTAPIYENNTNFDIVELDASNLLAKYTHHCHVCGKGFKRDANLRMHMRAHGEEYKTSTALSNPMKSHENECNSSSMRRRYSCPQEGCRWNQKHVKFQPLKSLICVKNHYKRTHCPKIYVCKRCSRKQFSVLSDLKTHEKHCGKVKWLCSCGTSFSRKDKLMGHVALFAGHAPAISFTAYPGKL